MQRLLMAVIILPIILALTSAGIQAQACDEVSVDVTVEISTDAGFEGLYKYVFSAVWETSSPEEGDALSYILFSLGVECPCLCDSSAASIVFPDPAGTSTSDVEGCEAVFDGFIECNGHEDITDNAVVKFEVRDTSPCEPVSYGSGTWIFYSSMSPLPAADYPDAVFIKHGEMICLGDLSGQLPNCYECVMVSNEESTWGSIKSIYR